MKLTQLNETKEKLTLEPLPYARDALEPVMSKKTVIYHYDHLTKGYVDRFNSGEGDPAFNEAGAFLHAIFWAQFRAPKTPNRPIGAALKLIEDNYDSYEDFKDQIIKAAKTIQGSGWVYLSKSGEIKTIPNHKIKRDILIAIDFWEHTYALDYEWDKDSFLSKIWRCIDWTVINHRLSGR